MDKFNVDILYYTWYIQNLLDLYKVIDHTVQVNICCEKIDSNATIKIVNKLKKTKLL